MLISNADIGQNDRQALELEATKFATNFCPYQTGIIDALAQLLLPQAGHERSQPHKHGIRAKLSGLNIYSAPDGGHPPWKDTRKDPSHLGTLVIFLPVEHDGGQLLVRHDKDEKLSDWKVSYRDATYLSWTAFNIDCAYEILKVTKGHKVTLTYDLFATRGQGYMAGHSGGKMSAEALPLYKTLRDAMENPKFFKRGGCASWNQ